MNQSKQKQTQVVTKSCLLTSDEHIKMYDEKINKKGRKKKPNKKGKMSMSRGKQKKQSSGVRTRGRHRKRGGGIRTHGGKRKWLYIPPEESSTKEEDVEQDEEEDWECKACGENNGVANDFLGLFRMWHLQSAVPHSLCKQKCWWFFSVPVLYC